MIRRRLGIFGLFTLFAVLVALLPAFAGCAAVATAIQHKDLQVETKVAGTVFTEPVPPEKKTVWLDIRNTSGKEVDLSALKEMIAAKGYRVLDDPTAVQLRLQINVLYLGRAEQAAIDRWIAGGYGAGLAGAAAGAAIGSHVGSSVTSALMGAGIGGLVAGLAETVINAAVKAVTYTLITDYQLSERTETPIVVQVAENAATGLKEGSLSTNTSRQFAETSNWRKHQARLAQIATQVNLKFEEAKAELVQQLLKSLAGVL